MRSVLISVRDLTRSVPFYCDVLGLREIAREGQAAVLDGEQRSFVVTLREVDGEGVRHGQQEVGLRQLSFDVGSRDELDDVTDRLVAAGALVSRAPLHEDELFDLVTGHDPDGLPLLFFTYDTGEALSPDHFRHVALHMYGVDI